MMTKTELRALRKRIERHDHLQIDEETSTCDGFSVMVRDPDEENFIVAMTWVASTESLNYLTKYGVHAHLESRFNGCSKNLDR